MRFLGPPVGISMRGKIRSTDTTKQVEPERIVEETEEYQRKCHNHVERVRPERMPWQAYYRPIWRRDTGRPSTRWPWFLLSWNGSWLSPWAGGREVPHALGGSFYKTNTTMQYRAIGLVLDFIHRLVCNVSETGSVSVLRWMGQDKHTRRWIKSKTSPIALYNIHHCQNPFKSNYAAL
jgi:hypothetical protein